MTNLDSAALEAAYEAYRSTPIDMLADCDGENEKCVRAAIAAYVAALPAGTPSREDVARAMASSLGLVWDELPEDASQPKKAGSTKFGYSQEIFEEQADAVLSLIQRPGAEPVHADDLAVDRFAAAMKVKLARKRDQGRGGWDNPDECSIEHLSSLLADHVKKGDPLDVGNLAMMIHQRGGQIAAPPSSDAIAREAVQKFVDQLSDVIANGLETTPAKRETIKAGVKAAIEAINSRAAIRALDPKEGV